MVNYILKRLLWIIPVMLTVATLVFTAIHLVPGDPARLMLGSYATPAQLKQVRQDMGLNLPLYMQYVHWLKQMISGNLGRSFTFHEPVSVLVFSKLLHTLYLAIASLIIAIPLGLLFGMASGVYKDSFIDKIFMIFSFVGISIPVFWMGLIAIIVAAQILHWLPASGMHAPSGGGIIDLLHHIVLPAVTLGLVPLSVIARITRASMLEVVNQDYIRTAHAKGQHTLNVILKHAFKNAMVPIITIMGNELGYVVGGAVVVETVFSWPGIGSLLIYAIQTRDFPIVIGGTIILSFLFVLINLVVDVLYGWFDPKIELK